MTRKGILRPAGAEDKRESGANPGQFPLLYALQCRRRIVEPLSRWGREGRLLFLETENCVAPATTSKLEALDCWEEDRL